MRSRQDANRPDGDSVTPFAAGGAAERRPHHGRRVSTGGPPMPIDMLARGMVNAAKMALEGKLIYHYREIRAISRQNIV